MVISDIVLALKSVGMLYRDMKIDYLAMQHEEKESHLTLAKINWKVGLEYITKGKFVAAKRLFERVVDECEKADAIDSWHYRVSSSLLENDPK